MDFRTCPACNSSVLEDDVEDCPFCGASMSGKPKPPQPKKAAAAKPSDKSPAASGSDKASPGKPTGTGTPKKPAPDKESASDDPFEVDTSAVRNAIKVSPRMTKSRTMEVVCPMCETHGYINPADGGKDVYCSNPKCMVPVFKAPRPVKVEAPVEEPKSNRMMLIAGGVVALLALGGAIYRFAIYEPPVVEIVNDDPVKNEVDIKGLVPDENTRVTVKEARAATLPEIRTASLSAIGTVADTEKQAGLKAECAKLAAISYARAGQLALAEKEFASVTANRRSEFKQIAPLVEIAWQELKENKAAAAKAHIDQAIKQSSSIQGEIREALDSCAALGAILVHQGRTADVNALLTKQQTVSTVGQFSAIWTTAMASGSFDVEMETQRPYHLAMVEPMRVAIVEILTIRGHGEQALAFANSGSNVAARDVCRAAWAGRLTDLSPGTIDAQLTKALSDGKVSAAGQCRAWAAVAAHFAQANKDAEAKTALTKAAAAMESIPPVSAVAVPSMKSIYNSKGDLYVGLPDPMPSRSAASAAADVATVQFLMGQNAGAWKSTQVALDYANAMTPSPVVTEALVNQCEKSSSQVKSRLNAEFELGGDDGKLVRYFGQYKTQCQQLNTIATKRLELQAAILMQAVEAGLLEETWTVVAAQANHPDKNQQVPYQLTRVPGMIKAFATQRSQSALLSRISKDFADKRADIDRVDEMFVDVTGMIAKPATSTRTISDAIEKVYKFDTEEKKKRSLGKVATPLSEKQAVKLDWVAFRLISRMLRNSDIGKTYELVSLQSDHTMKQNAFQLIAGHSIRKGTAPDLWKLVQRKSVQSTEERSPLELASLYYGFIQGTSVMPVASPAATSVTSVSESSQ